MAFGEESEPTEAAGASSDFVWRDAGRTVVLRSGLANSAPDELRERGFAEFDLLTTPGRQAAIPLLGATAGSIHHVAPGGVPESAAALLERASSDRLVALGGGRVIDSAKAIAAVTGAEVAAIPTTMSGAEMTGIHRLPAGAEGRARGLTRPSLVLADPELMTGQPEAALRSSAMNALGHGADSLYTPFANPASRMIALRGCELVATALDMPRADRDRPALALGSILCGYAIDSALFAIHHVICQTLVRVCGTPHAETNAAVLPHSMAAMSDRAPTEMDALAGALGTERSALATRITALGGHPAGLAAAGADPSCIDAALEEMLGRDQLDFTPDPPGRAELRRIVDLAW